VSDEAFRCPHCGRTNTYPNHVANRYCATCQHYCDRPEGFVTPEELGNPDWYAANTVEIGGEVMTQAQYDAARFPLEAERDRLRAVVDAAVVERDAYQAMPVLPHGEPHERWVQAHQALHVALDVSPSMGGGGKSDAS
jgi:hypothetical protein